MIGRIWKLGWTEIAPRNGVPDGGVPDPVWRIRPGAVDANNPLTRRELQSIFQFLGGSTTATMDFGRAGAQNALASKINDGLSRGDIVAFRRLAEGSSSSSGGGGGGGGSSSSSNPPPPTPRRREETSSETEKTWVEIQLIDEEGNPVAGERYILKITDGSTREGTLDAAGKVSVRNIDPGDCTVRFPDLDAREYRRKS